MRKQCLVLLLLQCYGTDSGAIASIALNMGPASKGREQPRDLSQKHPELRNAAAILACDVRQCLFVVSTDRCVLQ